jgi:predicted ATPase
VEAELVYQRGVPPQAIYTFKHALIQDAAYQSLLRSTRQQYHQRIAQVLAEQFPETAETQPELLAQHYTEAGLSALAVVYWQRAGKRASERSAYVEAISHLRKGLEVLQMLPDTPARLQHELALQTTLGPALIATRGYGAPEVAQVYTRARELCQQMGEGGTLNCAPSAVADAGNGPGGPAPMQSRQTPDVFPVLRGLWVFHEARAELQVARELAEQLLVLA